MKIPAYLNPRTADKITERWGPKTVQTHQLSATQVIQKKLHNSIKIL